MPEDGKIEPSKPGKTKKRLIATIIRWLFIALFAVLLLLGLFFHAPWKVLTLLSIFLAALTVLPRPFRKYFWGCVGGVVIAITIWVFLPDEMEGWRPYTFDKEVAALNAKYTIPDEQNAGIIYEKLAETFDGLPDFNIPDDDYTFDELSRKQWTVEEYPEYAEWLSKQDTALDMLMQATQLENCHFPIDANVFSCPESGEPIYPAALRWARFLAFAAQCDLGEGRENEALDKYVALLKLGNHFRQQPSAIYKLVGMATQALGLNSLNEFIMETLPNEKSFVQIEQALQQANFDPSFDIQSMLEFEKVYRRNELGVFYQINDQGKTRLTRDPFWHVREYSRMIVEAELIRDPNDTKYYKLLADPQFWQMKLCKVLTIVLWFSAPSNPKDVGVLVDKYIERQQVWANPEYTPQNPPDPLNKFLTPVSFGLAGLDFRYLAKMQADMAEGFYPQFRNFQKRFAADISGTHLLIALQRYKNKNGLWPEGLIELGGLTEISNFIDPLSKKPFAYKRDGEVFNLYSIGLNGIDEDGKRERLVCSETTGFDEHKTINTGTDDWLIWPLKLNSNDEEGADPNDDG